LINCHEISNFLERIACEVTFENGLTGVTATTELAAPATSIGINVQNLIGAKDGANPHVWYDPTVMPRVAGAAAELALDGRFADAVVAYPFAKA